MTEDSDFNTCLRRALAFIGSQTVELEASSHGRVMLQGARGYLAISADVLESLQSRKLIQRKDNAITLTAAGKVIRSENADRFQAQHRELDSVGMETPDGWESVAINLRESPLSQLARRRGRNGQAFLSESEIRAGERLRADFTRGQLSPKLGATWRADAISGKHQHGAGGMADLTDAALAARQRVEKAVVATGPELSGVLLDICCFLKGMEQVESERGWPVRSAKVMLKAALGTLHRHYEPDRVSAGRHRSLHWGTPDYRPELR